MGSIGRALQCHPDTLAVSVESITVECERSATGELWLRYHVDGVLEALALPLPAAPRRQKDLWKTTCFEVFVRVSEHADYAEFNFSSSSQWAAFHFDDYRSTPCDLKVDQPPDIGLDASETHFALESHMMLPVAWRDETLEIGLSAVVEESDGTKSYWALRHPPGPPDFHHPDCFALTLAAPEAP
jgi:hypothetical protein